MLISSCTVLTLTPVGGERGGACGEGEGGAAAAGCLAHHRPPEHLDHRELGLLGHKRRDQLWGQAQLWEWVARPYHVLGLEISYYFCT